MVTIYEVAKAANVSPKTAARILAGEDARPHNRERVMAAALRLMGDRGYAATTVADIAGEAEVAVDTIYKAFGSKLGVVQALIDAAGADAAIEAMRARWDAGAGRPADQLAAYVHGVGAFWDRHDDLVSIFVRGTGDAELAAIWADRQRGRRALIASLLGTWTAGVSPNGVAVVRDSEIGAHVGAWSASTSRRPFDAASNRLNEFNNTRP